MRCRDATPLLSAALDDELDAADRQVVTAHVATCTRCRREQRAYETLRTQLRVGEPIAVDLVPALRARLGGVERERVAELEPGVVPRRPGRTRVLAVVALAAAMLAAVVVVTRRPAPVRVTTRPGPTVPQLRAPAARQCCSRGRPAACPRTR